jgi:tetratricopeptide (TPR) repeat protein
MEPGTLSYLFLKVLPTLAKHAGQVALRELDTSVAKAARATAKEFPRYPDLASWLADWCASPEFFEIHAACTEGDRVTAEAVTGSFAKYVGSINPEHAERCAAEVLPAFLRNLDGQDLGSVGLAILDRRSEARHAELVAEQRQILYAIKTMPSNLPQTAPVPAAEAHSQSAEEKLVNSQLDDAKRLLDGGRPGAARVILDTARQTAASTAVTDATRFRLEALTGNYFLATRDNARAVEAFTFAVRLNGTNARARANLSTAKALLGRFDGAVADAEAAHELLPTDGFVASVYLRRLLESDQADASEKFITDHAEHLSDPYFVHVVAESWSASGKRDEAIDLLRPRLKPELAFVPAWELFGRALLQRAQEKLRSERILFWQIPEGLLKGIREAEHAISQAIELVENTEALADFSGVFVNRAHARHLLGDISGAEADYDRALALEPDLSEAHHAKALLAVDRSDYGTVLREMRKIAKEDLTPEMIILFGLAYVALNRPREAGDVLDAIFNDARSPRQVRIRAGEILVRAYRKLDDAAASAMVVATLEKSFPGDSDILDIVAEHREAFGIAEGAEKELEEAYRSAPVGHRSWLAIDLAAYYFRHQRWKEAADVYREIAGPGMQGRLRLNYAVSLLNSGQICPAHDLVSRARLDEGFDPDLAEVEVCILENIGDVEGANAILKTLVERSPQHAPEYRVQIATNLYRRGKKAEAANVLKTVEKVELAKEPELLMQAAKLRHWLGLGDVLGYAYRGWAANRGRAELALNYVFVSLARAQRDKSVLYPETATEGSRIVLRRGEEQRLVDLIAKDEMELPPGRVRASSPLGRKLVNCRVGDTIEISTGEPYRVEQIQSKYIAAHQDILRDFPFAFAGHPGLQRVEFNPKDPTPILAALDARHEFVTSALRMYREKRMPLATLSTILHESPFDVWLSLTRGDPEERLLAAEGNEPEVHAEQAALAQATDVVIELTSILTAVRLGLVPLLIRRFGRVYVVQAALDALLEVEAQSDDAFGPHGWIGKSGNQYVLTDHVNAAFQADRKRVLGKAIEFVTTYATVTPCRGQLDYSGSEFAGFQRTLGSEAVCSILLARELELPLYCDDLALRGVARGQWSVPGFWSQRLLVDCAGRGFLTGDAYYSHVSDLAREHYHFVQIDYRYLTMLIDKHHLTLASEVLAGINLLSDPACSIDSAVTVAASLVAACWINPLPGHFRHLLLDAVLGALTQCRAAQIVLQAFGLRIGSTLGVRSEAAREIGQTILLWKRILYS